MYLYTKICGCKDKCLLQMLIPNFPFKLHDDDLNPINQQSGAL